MDHAQGRAFHHHLARAIMHLNYLAGLLPFFEPSIEWDDPTLDQQFRTGRPSHASRSLHTFIPLPASSSPPTILSHGGIPSHMIANPEPNLHPLTVARYPREDDEQNPSLDTTTRNPVPTEGHTPTVPPGTLPAPDLPWATTRITTAVPVRSKQRATSTEDPQPKKKQRPASGPESTSLPVSLPIISEIPRGGFNSDDSDDDAASKAPSAHDNSAFSFSFTLGDFSTTLSLSSHYGSSI